MVGVDNFIASEIIFLWMPVFVTKKEHFFLIMLLLSLLNYLDKRTLKVNYNLQFNI